MPTDTQLSNLKINKLTHAQYQSATKGDEFYVKQDRDGIFFNGKGVELPPGLVAPFAGSVAPAGWLICDGSAISRTTYKALFDVIGTTYGAGDGSSTFNLPNFDEDFIVEKKDPTSSDKSWYVLHRSGFVIQGGFIEQASSAETKTINLSVEMADTNYYAAISNMINAVETTIAFAQVSAWDLTKTTFKVRASSNGSKKWIVIGKGLASTYNKNQIIKY